MEDRLLKPQELAERLGTSLDWVYRHWKDFPFTVKLSPRQLRFSEQGLTRYLARQQHDGSQRTLVARHDD
jgi:predicted DNA-binding transcriptional regulator AlpA